MSYLSLKDYGVIGNQDTAALISRLGSVDWCCMPYLDSPSHFGSLLDENQGGLFQIAPTGDFHSEQKYVTRTNVLETHFETPSGRGIISDWMPMPTPMPTNDQPSRDPIIHRRVEVVEGEIQWKMTCMPRFGYGAESVQAETHQNGILFRGTLPEDLGHLGASIPLKIAPGGKTATATFSLKEKETAHFSWTWGRNPHPNGHPSLERTLQVWRSEAHDCKKSADASGKCVFAGPWHDAVVRSSLVLKLMMNSFAGSLAESVTTSLPSLLGGTRNWDYRYTWVRDSALAMQALYNLGHVNEAERLFSWLSDLVIRDGAEGLQGVYTLDGGRFLPERELTFLSGYAGSRPVRIGNLSARQFQLDIYGHVMLSALQHFRSFGSLPEGLWPRLADIAEYVCQAWRRPDKGPWEVRSKPEHFVASKVLCWVALDRACWLAAALGEEVPTRWQDEKAILHRTICDQGYDESRKSFVRAFGDRDLDSAALLIPLLGFLPADDYRVLTTIDAIQSDLSDGVLIHRFCASDGLPESDGGFLLCSSWFISCLALAGRVDEASDRLAELCTFVSPLGLFGEQVDPITGNPAGNFPSAGAHLALVNATLYVAAARGKRVPTQGLVGSLTREPPARPVRPVAA